MANWQKTIAPIVHSIEKVYDACTFRVRRWLGILGPVTITPFYGYAGHKRLRLVGRVLKDRKIPAPGKEDSLWRNFLSMFKRFDSWEIPHSRVRASFQQQSCVLQADEEGMFTLSIEPEKKLPATGGWLPVEFELLEPHFSQNHPVRATGQVLVPPASAQFGVISDIDDTVVQTEATHLIRMARNILFSSARTRLPFAGGPALYRALQAGGSGKNANPIFYVSNGLWNLYDVLVEFFQLQKIPLGPLLMRNWGFYKDELLPLEQTKHKLDQIRPILNDFPDLDFILIGDSGEADPEIYEQIVQEFPGRICAIYIRNVDPDPDRIKTIRHLMQKVSGAKSALVLSEDSISMAQHAYQRGWIHKQGLLQVQKESKTFRPEK